ncbi:MAG: hypothetical protein ACRENE_01025 [Polyangiaceae bacterium]
MKPVVSRWERWLTVGTPVVAIATVGLGLEIGAKRALRAALVYAAPPARGASTVSWQIVVSDEQGPIREPVDHADLDVVLDAGGRSSRWHGATNDDGVAEMTVEPPSPVPGTHTVLEARSGGVVLARGDVQPAPLPPRLPAASPWTRFTRRDGVLEVDVAVLGERVAPSMASSVWVRVRDAMTHAPAAHIVVTPLDDPSIEHFSLLQDSPGDAVAPRFALTDSRGWAEVGVTPVGLAVSFAVYANAGDPDSRDKRIGKWVGGLTASPGAPRIRVSSRESPDEDLHVEIIAPLAHQVAYLEIDDDTGRAWAKAVDLVRSSDGTAVGEVRGPQLRPGLYWAISAGDPVGASALGPGTLARPFFVARTDEEALSFGRDPDACALSHDVRETTRAVDTCLAMAVASPVPRWVALDGFASARARDASRRAWGLAVALGGVAIAVVLEALLLLRSEAVARASWNEVPVDLRRGSVAVAVLTGLLGFALLAAFVVRLS